MVFTDDWGTWNTLKHLHSKAKLLPICPWLAKIKPLTNNYVVVVLQFRWQHAVSQNYPGILRENRLSKFSVEVHDPEMKHSFLNVMERIVFISSVVWLGLLLNWIEICVIWVRKSNNLVKHFPLHTHKELLFSFTELSIVAASCVSLNQERWT